MTHLTPPEEATDITMKQTRQMMFSLGIIFLFVTCLTNVGQCGQVSAAWPPGLRAAGDTAYPPFVAAPPVFCASPTYGPPQFDNHGLSCQYLPSTGQCGSEFLPIRLTAQVGYGYSWLNFGMNPSPLYGYPARPPLSPVAFLPNLELAFKRTDMAVGSIEANAKSCCGLSFSVKGQGNVQLEIGVDTQQEILHAKDWEGSGFQWWTLEGNFGFRLTPCWSVLLGLRREEQSLRLTDPKPTILPIVQIPDVLTFSPASGAGKLASSLWLPYLGLEATGCHYRACLLWSPLASLDMGLIDNRSFTLSLGNLAVQAIAHLDYAIRNKSGDFVEYDFAYDLGVPSRFAFQLWCRGNCMWLRGRGDFRERVVGAIGPIYAGAFNANDSQTANFTRWMLSGGIGTSLAF
jgi:hypothetical protein